MVAEKSSISESQHQEIISAAYNPERLQQAAIITKISKTSTSTITTTTSNKDKNVKAEKTYSTIRRHIQQLACSSNLINMLIDEFF